MRAFIVNKPWALSIFYLCVITLASYNTALLPHRTFLPADLLLVTPPWQNHAASLAPHLHVVPRPDTDPILIFYPMRKYLAESLQAGYLPLWNTLMFCGMPFAATDQTAAFYPINWLFSVIPLASAFGWIAALNTFFAGFFFLLYGRRIGWNWIAALAGATVWMLCGVMVVWQMWQIIDSSVCYLPLALYFIEGIRLSRTSGKHSLKLTQTVGLGVALGMSMLAGHIQFSFFVCFTSFVYGLVRLKGMQELIGLAVGACIAIGVSSIQLLPTADLLLHTLRMGTTESEILSYAMPPSQLVTLIAPDIFGGMRDWSTHPYYGFYNYYELTFFAGAGPLIFSFFGLRKRNTLTWFYCGLALFSLLMGCGTPLYHLFYYLIPLYRSFHAPARIFILLDFSIAALCAHGINTLCESTNKEKKQAVKLLIPCFTFLLIAGYFAAVFCNGSILKHKLTHEWLLYGLIQIAVAAAFGYAACAVIFMDRRYASFLLVPLIAAEMLHFAVGINPSVQSSLLFPNTPSLQYVTGHLGGARVLCISAGAGQPPQSRLIPNEAMALGWRDAAGYDSLMFGNYNSFINDLDFAQTGVAGSYVQPGIIAGHSSPVLDRLDVKYIVSPRKLHSQRFQLVKHGTIYIYLNPKALGARLVSYWWTVLSAKASRALLFRPGSIPNYGVLVNAPPPFNDNQQMKYGNMQERTKSPGEEEFYTQQKGNGLLVTDIMNMPGWKFTCDGALVKPLIADTLFYTIPLSTGTHLIACRYVPNSVLTGLYITCVTWLVIAAILGYELARRWIRELVLESPEAIREEVPEDHNTSSNNECCI